MQLSGSQIKSITVITVPLAIKDDVYTQIFKPICNLAGDFVQTVLGEIFRISVSRHFLKRS